MSIEPVQGTPHSYYLISFDAKGRERTDDPDGKMSELLVNALIGEPFTDLFLFSHGWKGDMPGAKEQFSKWIRAMAECSEDVERMKAMRPNFKPILAGLHWPSLPFGEENFVSEEASFSVGDGDHLSELVERYAERIADTSAAREALRTIFAAAMENINPPSLPVRVQKAYVTLDKESGLGSLGIFGRPGEDRMPFDPESAYQNSVARPTDFGGGLLSGLLAPLVQLSFWKMKDRACSFGESGGFDLISKLLEASKKKDIRVHLMGHSFGCIVVSACLSGGGNVRLSWPVSSLVLVQGALSLWSYCASIPEAQDEAGYFHGLIANNSVSGPIITTLSMHDTAVGNLYPLAAGVAGQVAYDGAGEFPKYGGVGSFGARGKGIEVVDLKMVSPTEAYPFEAGKIYNIESSGVIRNGGGISGAHSDIAHPGVAHAVWAAACVQDKTIKVQ